MNASNNICNYVNTMKNNCIQNKENKGREIVNTSYCSDFGATRPSPSLLKF